MEGYYIMFSTKTKFGRLTFAGESKLRLFGVVLLFCPLGAAINRHAGGTWVVRNWFGKLSLCRLAIYQSVAHRCIDLPLATLSICSLRIFFFARHLSGPKLTRKTLTVFFFNCFANPFLFAKNKKRELTIVAKCAVANREKVKIISYAKM